MIGFYQLNLLDFIVGLGIAWAVRWRWPWALRSVTVTRFATAKNWSSTRWHSAGGPYFSAYFGGCDGLCIETVSTIRTHRARTTPSDNGSRRRRHRQLRRSPLSTAMATPPAQRQRLPRALLGRRHQPGASHDRPDTPDATPACAPRWGLVGVRWTSAQTGSTTMPYFFHSPIA
jgi:hypothetical protein